MRSQPSPDPRALLEEAGKRDRAGETNACVDAYEACIASAESSGDDATLAEALRLLAITYHRRLNRDLARELCNRSRQTATRAGDSLAAAKALNTLAAFDLADGEIDAAHAALHAALNSAALVGELRARIEQNLGIIANIQGKHSTAVAHYQQALQAFEAAGDERGCAMAFNSLGMVSADEEQWTDADAYFRRSIELTTLTGDVHLRAIALCNQAEVTIACGRFEEAFRGANEALAVFDRLGAERNKSDAYKVLGIVYRATGRIDLAENRFLTAIDVATRANAHLERAEASRELGLLYRQLGRNLDSLRLLNAAHELFHRLDARVDMVDVAARRRDLESTYLKTVLDWGQSIESIDSYTHGHCERVGTYAVAVARELGLDENAVTTIRLGAYLHDLGKVRVPHEILNKRGSLTEEEQRVMQLHPVHGVELLAEIEFPWDIKPIIRWHHERYGGGGYPDGLIGDEIPVSAQIICIVDVFDALTTSRSYRDAMSKSEALGRIRRDKSWWRPDVYRAFLRVINTSRESDGPTTLVA